MRFLIFYYTFYTAADRGRGQGGEFILCVCMFCPFVCALLTAATHSSREQVHFDESNYMVAHTAQEGQGYPPAARLLKQWGVERERERILRGAHCSLC